MREVTIGGQKVQVHASPLSLYFYEVEFGRDADLVADLLGLQVVLRGEFALARFAVIPKIAWTLAKTAAVGDFPDYEPWLAGLSEFDFADVALITSLYDECRRCFFRTAATAKAEKPRHSKHGLLGRLARHRKADGSDSR